MAQSSFEPVVNHWMLDIKCDYEDKERYKTLEELVKELAVLVYSVAGTLKDNNMIPSVVLRGDDFFSTIEEITMVSEARPERLLKFIGEKYGMVPAGTTSGPVAAAAEPEVTAPVIDSGDQELLEALKEANANDHQ